MPQPPATKLEAFRPAKGAVRILGYTELGNVSGVGVDIREVKDQRGASATGLRFDVAESASRSQRAFVDIEEIPELLAAIDAMLALKENPTSFDKFEAQYTTKGQLQIVAFNAKYDVLRFSVGAGRVVQAQAFLDVGDMRKLRALIAKGAAGAPKMEAAKLRDRVVN